MRSPLSRWAFAAVVPSSAEARRVALVVGNAKCQHARVLDNAANDGRDMARTLSGLGFAVVDVLDANLPTFGKRDLHYAVSNVTDISSFY